MTVRAFGRYLEVWASRQIHALPTGSAIPERLAAVAYCAYVGANPMFNSPSFALTMTDPQKERKLGRSFKLLASSHSLNEPAWLAGT